MFCIARSVLRWGLIGGLALGGATLLVGPQRVAAGLAHVRAKAQSVFDGAMDEPTALRHQIQELAQEYPHRIAAVQSEIGEVEYQIGEFQEDCEVAQRVVAMTTADLGELKSLIARAGDVESGTVYIRFDGRRFDPDQARGEAMRISEIRRNYDDRLACNRQQLEILHQQKDRLGEILGRLSDEYSTFEAQTWQLDRQIDAIERNERLIAMTEQLQATLAAYDKWGKVGSLKQLESKLHELQRIQQAQIETLARLSSGARDDYEQRARFELEQDGRCGHPLDEDLEPASPKPSVTAPSVAWIEEPVIIENNLP